MLDELTKKLGLLKAMDVLFVLEGVKHVSRIMVDEFDKKYFESLGLYVDKADFKVSKLDTGSYSNKGKVGGRGSNFVYLSKNSSLVKEAKETEGVKDNTRFGELLGYPKCCTKFFKDNFEEYCQKNYDLLPASLLQSKGFIFPWQMNIGARYFDFSLINHFPCSFGCKESLDLAKKYISIVDKHSPSIGVQIRRKLQSAVLHTSIGNYLLENPRLKGEGVFYDKVYSTSDNKLSELLKIKNHFKIIDKNNIVLDGVELKRINFMMFV